MTTHFFADTAVLQGRSARHILRSPDTIITITIVPIAFLLLFVYVFGGAIETGSNSYVTYLLPGILLITIAFSYPLIFLPFVSSAFVPTESMPGPVRVFAENQPVTSIVDAIRNLLTGQPVGSDIWVALAWCVGILMVAYVFAMIAFRRRISG